MPLYMLLTIKTLNRSSVESEEYISRNPFHDTAPAEQNGSPTIEGHGRSDFHSAQRTEASRSANIDI